MPLERLGRLLRWHRTHQHRAVDREQACAARRAGTNNFQASWPLTQHGEALPAPELPGDRREAARELVARVRARWQYLLSTLDLPCEAAAPTPCPRPCRRDPRGAERILGVAGPQVRRVWKDEVRAELQQTVRRPGIPPASSRAATRFTSACSRAARVRGAAHARRRLATLHTNIPVNSDNYDMLLQANAAVARIMRLAKIARRGDFGRARHRASPSSSTSTRMKSRRSAATSRKADPHGRFNAGKLLEGSGPAQRLYPQLQPASAPSR